MFTRKQDVGSGSGGHQERLSARQQSLDVALLILACIAPFTALFILGGAREWIAFPLFLVVFFAGALFAIRNIRLGDRAPSAVPLFSYCTVLLAFLAIHGLVIQGNWGGARDEWLHVAAYTVTFAIITCLCRYHRRAELLVAVLVIAGSLQAWYALGQHIGGTTDVLIWDRPTQYGMRASGTFMCPNHFAQALTSLIILALVGLMAKGWKLATRIVCGYSLCIMLPAQLLTLSRAGLLGLLSGLIVFSFLISFKKSKKVGLLSLLVIPLVSLLGGLAVWLTMPHFRSRIIRAIETGDIRLHMWSDCRLLIQENFLWGYGGGTFVDVFSQFRESFAHASLYLRYAHNEFIHYQAEYGILGLGLFIGLGCAVLFLGFKGYMRSDRPHHYSLGAGLIALTLATGVHTLFDFNFHMMANVMLVVVFCAVVFGSWGRRGLLGTREQRGGTKRMNNIGLLVFCILCFTLSLIRLGGIQAMHKASQLRLNLDPAGQELALKRAAKIDFLEDEPYKILGRLSMSRSRWTRDEKIKRASGELALHYYEEALRRNAWDVKSIYGMARQYFEWGEMDRALTLVDEAIAKDPFYAEYYVQKGLMLKSTGQYSDALEVFEKALELNPTNGAARINIEKLKQVLKNS